MLGIGVAGLAGLGGAAVLVDRELSGGPGLSTRFEYGCYYPGSAGQYNFDRVEQQVGHRFRWYSTFLSLDSSPEGHSELMAAAATKHDILIGFRPTRTAGVTFDDILAGRYDASLRRWFGYLRSLPCKVVIRWAWEMNGDWMPYSPVYVGHDGPSSHCRSPDQFISVWRYVVRLQRTVPATNIQWFFCPNATDTGGIALERFFPGVDYAQIVGYDSYNTLNTHYMSALQTLQGFTASDQGNAYDRVCQLHPTADVWIGETGCLDADDPKEPSRVAAGHPKAAFWRALFAVKGLPRLKTIVFFDAKGTRDWRFDSSPQSLAAFRTAIARTA